MVKVEITHQSAKRLPAQLAEFGLVDFLEQRALVPLGTRIAAQFTVQLGLGHVHHLNLQGRIGFRVVDRVGQPAPTALKLLILGVVDDLIHLCRQLFVDLGQHGVNRVQNIIGNQAFIGQCFAHQRSDGIFNFLCRDIAAWFEILLQNR